METLQQNRTTPILIFKIMGLSICMVLGFVSAFYVGYNHLTYAIGPIFLLELACSPELKLITIYLKRRLFQLDQLSNIKGCFHLGCFVLTLSAISSIISAVSTFGYTHGLFGLHHGEKKGDYIALGSSVLSVFWSCVLVYDAKYYWNTWQRLVANNLNNFAGSPVYLYP